MVNGIRSLLSMISACRRDLPQSLSLEAIQSLVESDQWLITRVQEAQAAINATSG